MKNTFLLSGDRQLAWKYCSTSFNGGFIRPVALPAASFSGAPLIHAAHSSSKSNCSSVLLGPQVLHSILGCRTSLKMSVQLTDFCPSNGGNIPCGAPSTKSALNRRRVGHAYLLHNMQLRAARPEGLDCVWACLDYSSTVFDSSMFAGSGACQRFGKEARDR